MNICRPPNSVGSDPTRWSSGAFFLSLYYFLRISTTYLINFAQYWQWNKKVTNENSRLVSLQLDYSLIFMSYISKCFLISKELVRKLDFRARLIKEPFVRALLSILPNSRDTEVLSFSSQDAKWASSNHNLLKIVFFIEKQS